jgi:quinohemoprotein amine dehydrogenase beta subunit
MTSTRLTVTLAAGAGAMALLFCAPATTFAKDYLLTGVKPDKLVVIDAAARKIDKVIDIPDAGPGLTTITPSPDGKTAYTVVNKWESVSGVDLESGKEVFRAELSGGDERGKNIWGMDMSPDGKELAVYVSPVRLGVGEYEVLPTEIRFFDPKGGMDAEPTRTIPAPRQVTVLMYSKDGTKLYGMGRSLYVIDPQTGEILKEFQTQGWDRQNFYPPDILDVWSQWEQSGIFSTPYYTARSDMDLSNPEAYWTGILTLDLDSGEFKLKDVENTEVFYFSSVVSPTDPHQVFGVYNTLAKLDIQEGKSLGSTELDHSYYDINVSSDGKELYLGGTLGDTLEKLAEIEMPGGANQVLSTLRVIQR